MPVYNELGFIFRKDQFTDLTFLDWNI